MDYKEFRKKLIKAEGTHKFKITHSHTTKEAWRWVKKNKWLNIKQPITEREFGYIIKSINLYFQEQLLEGKDVKFPYRMGRLEIRKYNPYVTFKNGKLKTSLPIDWKKTIELWYEDKEAYNKKTIVRQEAKEGFIIYYNKILAMFNNKSFYQFIPTRAFKKKLYNKILTEGFDALLLKKKDELY